MKKFLVTAAVALGVFIFQMNHIDAGVKGTVWRCEYCKGEVKMPPYENPGDYSQYKRGCNAAPFGDRHNWKPVGYHFSDGSVSYTK